MNCRASTTRVFEIACVFAYGCLLAWQLLVPPFVGMANNGDFCRVLGKLSMGPERPVAHPYQMNRDYFVSDYTTAAQWKTDAGMFSSAIPVLWIARETAGFVTRTAHFDIRYFGAFNSAILVASFALALRCLRTRGTFARYCVPILLIVIFTDAAYVCEMNSFYMDSAAIVFLLLTAAAACLVAIEPNSLWRIATFLCAGVLLVASKSQHALLGIPAAAMSLWFAYRTHTGRARGLLIAAAGIFLLVTVFMLKAPDFYRAAVSYDLVFFKLTKIAKDPLRVLTDLGLSTADAPRIGAFTLEVPPSFEKTVPLRAALTYLLSHPSLVISAIDTDLRENTHPLKPPFANYRKEDGVAPLTETRNFRFWSDLRSKLNKRLPYNLVLLYPGGFVLLCFPSLRRKQFAPVAGFLLLAGSMEFVIVSLTGGMDTVRHLTIFHVITDLLLVIIAAGMLEWLQVRMATHPTVST